MLAVVIADYNPDADRFHDELFAAPGKPRPGLEQLVAGLTGLGPEELMARQRAAERSLMTMGITFTVYGDGEGTERIFPFDVIPRVIPGAEWAELERGLEQRITALNLFIADIYSEQKILADGVVPRSLVETCGAYRRQCLGLKAPRGIWCHITGTDLIRHRDGTVYVLEDNLRCPSGVSYVLENRQLMKRIFPRIFERTSVRPVDDYAQRLLETLQYLAPDGVDDPQVVVLTPGIYNSAYYEHAFLAQQMGVELVSGPDLVVEAGSLWMRTTRGLKRVDVIYRRIDDDFLDPTVFRADSMLGVPGLMEVYLAGRVALANAPGTGVADDKALYRYVPEIIKYYLDQDALIPNVPTFICDDPVCRQHVLENIADMVVKTTDGAGGYGMLIGPASTAEQREQFRQRILAEPRHYIAQPTLSLSRVPTIVGDGVVEGRHVDLRPYILYGRKVWVQPGGLTRVALRKGSLVVNSSQGGGSKDTWVLQ